ncbi:MAG: rod shape-determining protein MreC [Acidobacteria bacterium RIFCSPLOWO2_12_FULL_54_10]|nr:MAG: rod shape-determining protein MreC [Acidobacteria bacterium RIFCSPLOWO2_12_FULL_54_10]
MIYKHRNLAILVAVLFAQLTLLVYQARQNQDAAIFRYATILVITPLQRSFQAITSAAEGMWTGYIDLRGARRENVELFQELNELKLANQRLENEVQQARRLQGFHDFQRGLSSQMIVAQVIGSTASDTSRLILIDKGANDGLRLDQPVIIPDGVVGKVLHVFPSTSQIQLITDAKSGVAVLLENSRSHGILKGANESTGYLAYVPLGEEPKVGEKVITSGEDGIFPKGLPAGEITLANKATNFWDIEVKPTARLNRLEEVLIILHEVSDDFIKSSSPDMAENTSPPNLPQTNSATPAGRAQAP